MPTPRTLLLSLSVLLSSSLAHAQTPPPAAPPELKAKGVDTAPAPAPAKRKAAPPPVREKMIAASRDATRGYYKALIAAKYDEAASFLHPSAIEPLRTRVLEDLEKGPPQKTENTLGVLGIKDLGALRSMTLDDFYVAWAKSSYGQGVQVLSKKELQVDVILEPPVCSQERRVCQVSLKLRGLDDKGEKMESPSTVWVVQHEGRWLLTLSPPA